MSGRYNPPMACPSSPYVSRGGVKLAAALDAFGLDPAGLRCADFGCNVGGFTDCLLQRGARQVLAVDTGYGELAWTLRNDPRVVVMERTNALHAAPPPEPIDLVVIDVAFTPLSRIVPAAGAWLGPAGEIVALLKPHFELAQRLRRRPHKPLTDPGAREVCLNVQQDLHAQGFATLAGCLSPVRGKGGNCEFLLRLRPRPRLVEPPMP